MHLGDFSNKPGVQMPNLLEAAIAKNDYTVYTVYTSNALRVSDLIKNNPGENSFV